MPSDRLGAAVRLRRKQLKLTQADVAERGGLGVTTVRGIENNRLCQPTGSTQRALERGLEWLPGSVDAILKGGAPRTQETAPPVAPAGRHVIRPPRTDSPSLSAWSKCAGRSSSTATICPRPPALRWMTNSAPHPAKPKRR